MTTSAVAECPVEHPPAAPSLPSARCQTRAASETGRELVALLRDAGDGDNRAWEELHARFTPMLRGIARGFRLSPNDVEDVVQATWMRLFVNVGRLRDPAAVAGWLATTVRRECLALLQRPAREYPTDDPELGDRTDLADPESELLAAEQRLVLGRALATLPSRQRELISLLVAQPSIAYQELSTTLDMPIGSIGPIRARGLARLQRHPELRSFCSSN